MDTEYVKKTFLPLWVSFLKPRFAIEIYSRINKFYLLLTIFKFKDNN